MNLRYQTELLCWEEQFANNEALLNLRERDALLRWHGAVVERATLHQSQAVTVLGEAPGKHTWKSNTKWLMLSGLRSFASAITGFILIFSI